VFLSSGRSGTFLALRSRVAGFGFLGCTGVMVGVAVGVAVVDVVGVAAGVAAGVMVGVAAGVDCEPDGLGTG